MKKIVTLMGNLMRIGLLPLWWMTHRNLRLQGPWVVFDIPANLGEFEQREGWIERSLRRLRAEKRGSVQTLRAMRDAVLDEVRVTAVLVRLPKLHCGWSTTQALMDLVKSLRSDERKIVCFLHEGGGNQEYAVACQADEIWMPEHCTLTVLGSGSESIYPRKLLKQLGIDVQVVACGKYKTAAERFTDDSMSDAQREQMTAIIDARDSVLRDAIHDRFSRVDKTTVSPMDVLEDCPCLGQWAKDKGYIDQLCSKEDLREHLQLSKKQWQRVSAARALRHRQHRLWRALRQKPVVAVIEIHGMIVPEGFRGTGKISDEKAMLAAIEKAKSDRRVVAVILEVNSPGGSAEVSETVFRAVRKLKHEKPVVAYFSDVAASGGYFIGAAADAIVAQPLCITGSIGVISMKPFFEGLLEKLHLRVERLQAAPHATMFSPYRKLKEKELSILRREADLFYGRFVRVVAESRKMSEEEVHNHAQGRVWTAAAAEQRKLVDQLGGSDTAVAELCQRLKMPVSPEAVETRIYPTKRRDSLFGRFHPLSGALQRMALELSTFSYLCSGREKVFYYWPGWVPRHDE